MAVPRAEWAAARRYSKSQNPHTQTPRVGHARTGHTSTSESGRKIPTLKNPRVGHRRVATEGNGLASNRGNCLA